VEKQDIDELMRLIVRSDLATGDGSPTPVAV
jgi:hypothetical protein